MKKIELESNLKEFAQELKFDEKAKGTLAQYQRVCDGFINSIKHENDITKDDVMNFKAAIIEEFKPATVKNYITIINKFICYCEFGTLDRNKKK